MHLRGATRSDAEAIAVLFRKTRETCLPFLPVLHTPAEDLEFFSQQVVDKDDVWVAECDGIVAFCAFGGTWLNHLYVDRAYQGRGIGSALLKIATDRNDILSLWVFQQNVQAIRFYESKGFVLVEETDESNNEKRATMYRRA